MADTFIQFYDNNGVPVRIRAIDNLDAEHTHSLAVEAIAPMQAVVDPNTSTPTAFNVPCTNANTEYSQALPANCRGFEFQARTEAILRFAFVTGKVAGPTAPYMTLKAGDFYFSPPINQAATPSILYLASPTAGTVVEILAWV